MFEAPVGLSTLRTVTAQVDDRVEQTTVPLRVAVTSWAPFCAGAEVAALRLSVGLREAGHQVTVILGTDDETRTRMLDEGLDVRLAPLAFTNKWKWYKYCVSQLHLLRLLSEIKPDVVHSNDLPTSQMVGQAARKLEIPRICHHRWKFDGAAIDWLNKFGAERHLFVSRSLMDSLCSKSPRLANASCEVIHDGLPLPREEYESDRLAARRKLGLSSEKQIVLFAGQIIERKGVADLLHSWTRIPANARSNAELMMIGDDMENVGAYRHTMERLARELKVDAHFRGLQRNVADWILASDICVVPSHEEPLGNATLEAMAHGRPVIATKVGGIPEMVVDGETGLLVPPKDPVQLAAAVTRLLGDVELQRDLGRSGRRRCSEKFSQDAHVDAVVRQYRQVIEERARVSA